MDNDVQAENDALIKALDKEEARVVELENENKMTQTRSQMALLEIIQVSEMEPAHNLQAAYLVELARWGMGENIPRPNWWTFRRYGDSPADTE